MILHTKFGRTQDTNLMEANLQNALLSQANLKGAVYNDSNINISFPWCLNKDCSTIFRDDFDPKKAGMILIRTQEDYNKWLKSRQK